MKHLASLGWLHGVGGQIVWHSDVLYEIRSEPGFTTQRVSIKLGNLSKTQEFWISMCH